MAHCASSQSLVYALGARQIAGWIPLSTSSLKVGTANLSSTIGSVLAWLLHQAVAAIGARVLGPEDCWWPLHDQFWRLLDACGIAWANWREPTYGEIEVRHLVRPCPLVMEM